MMEKYEKPVMVLEEVEDEVYTDTATGPANIVTEKAIVSEDTTPGQTLVNPTGRP